MHPHPVTRRSPTTCDPRTPITSLRCIQTRRLVDCRQAPLTDSVPDEVVIHKKKKKGDVNQDGLEQASMNEEYLVEFWIF